MTYRRILHTAIRCRGERRLLSDNFCRIFKSDRFNGIIKYVEGIVLQDSMQTATMRLAVIENDPALSYGASLPTYERTYHTMSKKFYPPNVLTQAQEVLVGW